MYEHIKHKKTANVLLLLVHMLKDGFLLIQMYFCKGYDHGEKVDLSKGYWNPKRKMWVTTHFS